MRARAAIACLLLAGGTVGAAAPDLDPSLVIRDAEVRRTTDGNLAFVLHFAGPADAQRVRVLLDTQPGSGEPGTGAEFMLEGAHCFQYPAGAPAWTWNEIAPPVLIAQSNELTCLLRAMPGLGSFGWAAATTRPDWSDGDRHPARGYERARFGDLAALDTAAFRAAVQDPHLDLVRAEAFRAVRGGLAFKLTFADTPDIARVRLMIDLDGPGRGEPGIGADYMVEGATFYAYPPNGKGWAWNSLEPALWVQESNTLTCLLFNLPVRDTIRWTAETTTPEWQSADRMPLIGATEARVADLPTLPPVSRPEPVDLSELLAQIPPSLTARFEDELATQEWTRANEPVAPSWDCPLFPTGLPVRLYLQDAITGQRAAMKPGAMFTADVRPRWGGRTLGVDWVLVGDQDADGNLHLTGQLKAGEPRCLSVTIGAELDLDGWTWHDDVRFRRALDPQSGVCANVASLPYGRSGAQSLYPFGVVSSDRCALAIETDPDEPRVFQIAADPAERLFGITYDLGLSPLTAKFPGRAAFRCTLRAARAGGPDAFRREVDAFYARHPDFQKRRSPAVGLWMPFYDISKLPSPQDFGFAFLEKEGVPGRDIDYCKSNGVLALYYTEPWLYWLPMPAGMPRTPQQALAWMQTLSTMGNARKNELAASALVSAARTTNGTLQLSFLDTPWNSGARMEVSTDPELPTSAEAAVNRAMIEWKTVTSALADPRIDGIYLDSMQAMQVVDYSPAAIGLADYPLVYAPDGREPGVAMPVGAFEYTAALGRYLHEHNRLLMGNFPCWHWPFFMPFIDIPGEETSWLNAGRYAPMDERQLNARRALSGHKPWGFLQAVNFDVFDARMVERYFRDCLFWAFLPSFFSHDGANDPYWLNDKLIERDRPLFKTYIPLIRRLATAGWEPVGELDAEDPALWIEHFGAADADVRHVTLRHDSRAPLRAALLVPRRAEPQLVIDPLAGAFDLVPAGTGTARVVATLGPEGIATRDVLGLAALDREIAFARDWTSGGREAEALLASLASLRDELRLGVLCAAQVPSPILRSRDQQVSVTVSNGSPDAVTLSNVLFLGRSGPQLLRRDALTVAPGATASVDGFIDGRALPDGAWLEFQWHLATHGTSLLCRRVERPLQAEPVFAALATTNVVSVEPTAGVDLDLVNLASSPRSVAVRVRGDFDVKAAAWTLGPRERRTVRLEVPSDDRTAGALQVRATSDDRTVLDADVHVTFLDETASFGRDSRVVLDVDSTYGGYATRALTDGITDTSGLPWNEAAWASEEISAPHWVRLRFPQPTAVSELRAVWNFEGGVRYTSQRGEVRAWLQDGRRIELGTFTNRGPAEATTVSFEPVQVQAIELYQPAGGGPPSRPNLLWLSEIEVR